MTLHVFNPEHDLALASGLANFTAPHAGRQLRYDLGFLPVLWAAEGDRVLVDDVDTARRALHLLMPRLKRRPTGPTEGPDSVFVDGKTVMRLKPTDIAPWGWDEALRTRLLRLGIDPQTMPSPLLLQQLRQLSHRRTAARLLAHLTTMSGDDTTASLTGEAVECTTADDVARQATAYGSVVLKAPWSSSGRGVRFADSAEALHRLDGWLRNVLSAQGSVMVEPGYPKVKDFGMEFEWCDGHVRYLALSLFHTANGAYTGNLLATEAAKRETLAAYLPTALTDRVQQAIATWMEQELAPLAATDTAGTLSVLPFGVDMMVVARPGGDGFSLHPCVELNLRRTMGHVALALTALTNPDGDNDIRRVMRVHYNNHKYQLKTDTL